MPVQESIENMKGLLLEALALLAENDSDLIILPEAEVIEYDFALEKYERKLHEVCINYIMKMIIKFYNMNKYNIYLLGDVRTCFVPF